MTDAHQGRPQVHPPVVSPPPPFRERRVSFRRAADRVAHRETALLAQSLDILAMDLGAEMRLAGVLELLARTAGARRAAVLAGSHGERRIAVSVTAADTEAEAEELAAWLDAWAPRSRAFRAASGRASVLIVRSRGRPSEQAAADMSQPPPTRHYACLPIPTAGDVVLGFDFADPTGPAGLGDRLPPQLARHAAVVLSLVTDQLATERDLEALRARDAERTRFVSTVAHELRTPLTGLSGYLDLILGGQVSEPVDERDFLERSRQIVDGMGELVADLLELSRLESGTLRLDLAPFSLAEVGTRVVDGLAPLALVRSLDLRTDLPPRLRSATGDRRRAEQILTNLVANAIKFTPKGSTVELAAWFDGPVALVAVRDEGSGIEAADRERIFDRFYRMADHERITGTGLGLPIARELARAMGGELDVSSVPGVGSAFVLVLPGPTGADGDQIETGMAAALQAETVRLEERGVLRSAAAARPRLVPVASQESAPVPSTARGPRPHLRALGGRASRTVDRPVDRSPA